MNEDKDFLLNAVERLLADKTVLSLAVTNSYGKIEISRQSEDYGATSAIGFAMDDDSEFEEE